MHKTPLYINSITDYMAKESESIQYEISKYFVKSHSFETLKQSILKGVRYINLIGSGGTGKTTNAMILSNELMQNGINSFLSRGEDIDLRVSRDIIFIDNIEEISKKRLSKILNSDRIKQFVLLSRAVLNIEKVDFELVKIPNLNQAEIKNLIDKRLSNIDSKSSSIVYESILKNRELLKSQRSPKAVLEFLNNTYQDIHQKVKESNKENISKDEKIKVPLSSVIGILISIMLFLLTQRNSRITTDTIIKEINDNQEQLIKLFESNDFEDDLHLCYLVSEDLNLRKYPRKTDSPVLSIAVKNSTIKLIEKRNKWWFVESIDIDNNEYLKGWVYSDYLTKIKQ